MRRGKVLREGLGCCLRCAMGAAPWRPSQGRCRRWALATGRGGEGGSPAAGRRMAALAWRPTEAELREVQAREIEREREREREKEREREREIER